MPYWSANRLTLLTSGAPTVPLALRSPVSVAITGRPAALIASTSSNTCGAKLGWAYSGVP